jgi:hypothetical protein
VDAWLDTVYAAMPHPHALAAIRATAKINEAFWSNTYLDEKSLLVVGPTGLEPMTSTV